ncbi:zinc finger protein [Betafusellovirus yellowstonense]|uniref:Zinc finger protein n=1 Tax=Betafusellovirus yellowstonense TaxID=693629 RepID=D1GFA6_9VIRU|nr:zinc finger protein [Acidianus spindle-shaped virus 1]ACZ35807.1 zinc finger protein [Acidianus spindle-shaped virus 1]
MLDIIISFYGFQFNDFTTTLVGLRMGAREGNVLARAFTRSLPIFVLYKFGLSTFLLLFLLLTSADWIMVFHFSPMWVIYGDTVLEGAVTCSNIYTIWRVKK